MSDDSVIKKVFIQDGFSVASLKTQIEIGDILQKGLNSSTLQAAIHQAPHQDKRPDTAPNETSEGDKK